MITPHADFLIESAYEVVNPIGGLYTVITTKSAEMRRYYKDCYYTIGSYCPKYARVEFEEKDAPPWLSKVFEDLKKEKIFCHFGTWMISGKPNTILIDITGQMKKLGRIKARLYKEYGIDCKGCGKEYNKRLVLSDSISILLGKLLESPMLKKKKVVFHQHISGSPGIPLFDAKKNNWNVGLVATAHSTRLGRDIAMSNEDIVSEIRNRSKKNKFVEDKREYGYGGETVAEHQLEKTSATSSDVFSAVSEITAKECKYMFHRKVDIVTPNGINIGKYPTIEERSYLHQKSKERIHGFLESYFLPYYPIDVKNSLLLFTSGRYEFQTKGFDVFIHSLGWLNKLLKKEHYPHELFVFFFIFDRSRKKQNFEVLENMSRYEKIGNYLQDNFPDLEKKAMNLLVHGGELDKQKLFDQDFLLETRKLMATFKRGSHRRPPLCALRVGRNDVIFNTLKSEGLMNKKDDKVKVIVYPTQISVGDGLLSMDYNDVIAGMHMGVFPSYYEPWGYTPLEAGAYSVPSITTDLAGFGKFVKDNSDQRKKPGIIVLRRDGRTHEQVVSDLTKTLHWFSNLPRTERVRKKMDAKEIANLADWANFSEYYIQAHNLAVNKCAKRVTIPTK